MFELPEFRARILRNIVGNYLGFIVNTVVALLLTPFLIDGLGPPQFGLWILMSGFFGYFQLLELGIMPAVIRHVSYHLARGEEEEVAGVVGSAAALLLGLSLLTLPLANLLAWAGPALFELTADQEASFGVGVWLVACGVIMAYFRRLLYAIFEGYQQFVLLNAVVVAGTVFGALLSVTMVLMGHGVMGLLAALAAQVGFEALVQYVLVVRQLGVWPNPFRASRAVLRRLLGFSLYAALMDLAVTISHRVDTVVIGAFLTLGAITPYAIAAKMAGMLESVTDPLIDTIFPLASELDGSTERSGLRRVMLTGSRISLLIVTPAAIMMYAYGADVIRWWIGDEHVAATAPILYIFVTLILASVLEATASRVLLGTSQVRFDAVLSVAMAAANLVLTLLLVRPFGSIGVAIGTLVPGCIGKLCFAIPYTCRLTGLSVAHFYSRALTPALQVAVPSAIAILATSAWLPDRRVAFVVHGVLVVALTAGVFLLHYRASDLSRAARIGGAATIAS